MAAVLAANMAKVEAGDLSVRMTYGGKDEIGRLSQAFDRMKKSLVHAMKMLEE